MDNEWHGASLESDKVDLLDPGVGKALIIRQFKFSFKPGLKEKPTRQQLFNQHWPQIRALIWGDGLVANEDVNPRVLVGKRGYTIIVLCDPRIGQVVTDTPTTINKAMQKKR